MGTFLIAFELRGPRGEYATFFRTLEGLGKVCNVTGSALLLDTDFDLSATVDSLEDAIGATDTLFVLDLETLELDGVNLPDCIADFIAGEGELSAG